jgi:hypothetical protein
VAYCRGGLPAKVFVGINENFVLAVIKGVLVMAGDFVDLTVLQVSIAHSGADVLSGGRDVWKTARIIT